MKKKKSVEVLSKLMQMNVERQSIYKVKMFQDIIRKKKSPRCMCKENQLVYLILSKKINQRNKSINKKNYNLAQQDLINIILNATV